MPKRSGSDGDAANDGDAKRTRPEELQTYHGFRRLVLEELKEFSPGLAYKWREEQVRYFQRFVRLYIYRTCFGRPCLRVIGFRDMQ